MSHANLVVTKLELYAGSLAKNLLAFLGLELLNVKSHRPPRPTTTTQRTLGRGLTDHGDMGALLIERPGVQRRASTI